MRPRSNARHLHLRALTIAVLAALPVLSGANPLDPTVVTGNATFQQAGSTLTVTNTPGSVIHWQSFSIGQNELTRFVQQSSASQVLNRVVGADPSQILGTLQSNGQVFLINPNGIAFGPNARVDVAGLVASSLNISNADFAAGRLNFSATLEAGTIRNDGRITALSGGNIYLVAPTVENHGVIQAADGAVVLAAGKSATLVDTHRPDVQVQISAPDNEAVNVGQIVGGHIGIYAGAIRNEGSLSASQAVQNTDGSITLRSQSSVVTSSTSTVETAGGRIDIDAGSVYHAGRIDASGRQGGQITVRTTAGVVQSGSIAADGTAGAGGRVTVESSGSVAQTVSATTSARGTTGGVIVLSSGAQSRTFLSGSVDASSATGSGGTIHVLGGDIALAGATLNASGNTAGGTILVGGDTRGTNAAIANANSVYATSTTTIRADAITSGNGGKVVLWSDGTTRAGATLSARGGSVSGDGGFIEVSGKDSTSFGGIASAAAPHGQAGTFLLDPRNAIIDDVTNGIVYRDLLDPNPNTDSTSGNGWGQTIEIYSGNTLVTDPYDNAMGVKSGAIYLYRGDDGALLTALTGAAAQDSVGIGHRQTLSGGNLLLVHTLFGSGDGVIDHAKGAVTWLNPNTGLLSDGTSGGAVGISNSLVGSTAGDRILLTVNNGLATPLAGSGGGYFLLSEAWNGSRGAITWINAATGALGNGATGGAVSATNSLVGENAGDRVGYGRYEGYPYYTYRPVVQTLGSGLLFFSAYYGSGGTLANGKGAVTWLNTSNGRFADGTYGGVLSSANSIVGGTAGDRVGVTNSGEASLLSMSGNALLLSPNFSSATGALTWINGTTGRLSDGSMGAVVSASNSFVGSSAGDGVGSISGTSVTGGYMFRMPEWNSARGAMMWINMATGATPSGAINGVVGASNSIVGGTPGDRFGSNVQTLSSNHFLVLSPDWDDTAQGLQDVGAVTWINRNGTLANGALAGTLSSATSLVGGAAFDRVGSAGIVQLSGSSSVRPLVVLSPMWGSGGNEVDAKGAVTWMSGVTGNTLAGTAGGVVSAANSLVGANAGDRIGTALGAAAGNGGGVYLAGFSSNVFVASPYWSNGTGAVTFISSTGLTANSSAAIGAVSQFNSILGNAPGSHVGEFVHVLNNGHVVLRSPDFTVGTGDLIDILGAVTWVNGTNGLLAGMSSSTQFGVEGSSMVSGSNSLIGANDGDRVGSGGLYNNGSTLLVLSPSVTVDAGNFTVTGAVTWMDRNSGRLSNMTSASLFPQIGGTVSAANSLLGLDVANLAITAVSGSNVLMLDKTWSTGRGALTWLSGSGLLANQATGGIVSESTSIVGSSDGEGATMSLQAVGSNYVLLTPDWSGFGDVAQAGAVTWINTSTGRLSDGNTSGFIDQSNSVVGSNAGDRIGSGGLTQLPYYYGSHLYFIHSPEWSDNGSTPGAGALTWFNSSTGLLAGMTSATDFAEFGGAVSAANSLVGAHAGDRIGEGTEFTRAEYYYGSSWKLLIRHAAYGEGAGAITWMQGTNGSIAGGDFGGVVSGNNSLLGSASGDSLGSGGIQRVSNQDTGQFFVLTPGWSDEGSKTGAGAVTWIDGLTGHLSDGSSGGVVSSANSLVGSAAGDAIGSGGVQRASNDYYEMLHLVLSPNWSDGGTKSAAGAVTWIDGSTGALIDDSTGGVVGAANSLVGGVAGDAIGSGGLQHLSVGGSRGLILSPSWSDGGTKTNAGAITWYNAQTKLLANGQQMRGVVSGSNSLVGSGAGDNVGGGDYYGFGSLRFRDLNGTWALVFSPEWSDGGTKVNAGAVTWLNMENGLLANMATEADFGEFGGAISASNSLLGAHAGDRIGGNSYDYYHYGQYFYSSVEYARNGAVFLLSPAYNSQAGAVTWLDRNNARLSNGNVGGTIGVSNSLIGDQAGDQVGSDLIGTYEVMAFVRSTEWHNRTGAVTPIDPMTGRLIDGSTGGVVSSGNSLVGSNAGDRVGYSYTSVYGGDGYNYLFYTPHWNNGRGAATWMSAHGLLSNMTSATGYNGTVSAANSLIGSLPEVVEESYGDAISGTRVFTVYDQNDDQHFVVMSGNWNDGRGAITRIRGDNGRLMDGATGGVVTAANSLVGSSAGDGIGAQAYPQGVGSGNSLIVSTTFGNGRGSVTLMPEDWSLVGTVNADNSVIGSRPNSGLQTNNYYYSSFLQDSDNGNSLIRFSTDGTGRIVVLANDFANDANPPVHFANGIGTDIAISPTIIENMLNAGTNVLIQANNDIIVRKAINATGTTTSNGALRFQAGRSILVNADVTNLNMDDGGMSIWMTAHESAANGVVASDRDSGAGEIRMALGTSITGGGTVRLEIGSGAGVGSAGGIYVANVSGALVEIINAVSQSVDANRIIEQLLNSTVRQTGTLGAGTNGVVMQASGAIVSTPTSLVQTQNGGVSLSGSSVGAPAAPMRLAAAGTVSVASTTGGAFLEQPQGSAGSGAYAVTVADAQPLVINIPNGVLTISQAIDRAGAITLTGGQGLQISTVVSSNSNVSLNAGSGGIVLNGASVDSSGGTVSFAGPSLSITNSTVLAASGLNIGVSGPVTITDSSVRSSSTLSVSTSSLAVASLGSNTVLGGNGGTSLNVSGNVSITGNSEPESSGGSARIGTAGLCTGTINGDLIITGGSASGASAQLFGSPDIGSAGSPLRIGGEIIMTTGSGSGSFARVSASLPETIYLNFFNATSGGFTVDGNSSVAAGTSGFYAGGAPAILGQNLIITYGGPGLGTLPAFVLPPSPMPTPWLAGPVSDSSDVFDERTSGLPQCR